MQRPLIVKGLAKAYGSVKAVDGLDIEIDKGEIFGLLGPNGAGKTTTIECILGVKRRDAGSVELLGMNPETDRKRVFAQVGVQFQETHFQAKIRVAEICRVYSSFYRRPADWRAMLKTFGLADMEARAVADLSGGERQRLSVVLALLPDPEVVFLDELTTGLDTKARRDVWKMLERLKKNGLTVFLTSHYMDEVEALCDSVCILRQGKPVITGAVAEVTAQSARKTFEDAYLWYSGEEAAYESV